MNVKLNCGGKLFEVSRDTINNYPNSMLARMINSGMKESEVYFLDRDPELFKLVLDLYRSGKMSIPDSIPSVKMYDELLFYGMEQDARNDLNFIWNNININLQNINKILDDYVMSTNFINKMKTKTEIKWKICKCEYPLFISNDNEINIGKYIKKYYKDNYNLLVTGCSSEYCRSCQILNSTVMITFGININY